jgi:MGT family glycosyltransferase
LFQTPEALTIAFFPREFQVAGDTFDPDRYVFAGPCLGDRSAEGFAGDRSAEEPWQIVDGRPVLLVSLGSMNYADQRALLRTCVAAFGDIPWQVVISTGTELDPAELGALPPNIEAHRQVPQLEILRHARVFVSHAGMGGTMEALSLGVPIVAIPQMTEQKIIANRVAGLGLGRVAAPAISAPDLRALTLEVAADEQIAASVRQLRSYIRDAGGTSRAADEIEAHLRLSTRTPA